MRSLNRHELLFNCDPAKVREILINRSEDFELNSIADARLKDGKPLVKASFENGAVGKRERNAVYRVIKKR